MEIKKFMIQYKTMIQYGTGSWTGGAASNLECDETTPGASGDEGLTSSVHLR